MNALKLQEVLRLIDLYEYDEDFRKFLLYNLSDKFDKYAEDGFNDSISEEYLKKAFDLLIENSKSEMETMNFINFFIQQNQYMSKQPQTYLRILNKLNTMKQSPEVLKTIESL